LRPKFSTEFEITAGQMPELVSNAGSYLLDRHGPNQRQHDRHDPPRANTCGPLAEGSCTLP